MTEADEGEWSPAPTRTNDLYHYTTAEVAVYDILDRRQIRLAPYESTNDLQETTPRSPALSRHEDDALVSNQATEIWNQTDWWLRRFIKVACFTLDHELPDTAIDEDALRGWAHMSQ